MTVLPPFTPQLDDWLTDEFIAQTAALLPFSTRQDNAILGASILRFERPEPPRDPDLPLLPSKYYPRTEAALVEATIRALVPPLPVEGFIGRRAELDQAVMPLLSGRPAVITGKSGIGKTAVLRQIAHDLRLRKSFKRVWWLEDMQDIGIAIGLALNAPSVLRAEFSDQPRVARDFLVAHGIMLIVDNVEPEEVERAMAFAPSVAVATSQWSGQAVRVQLGGLPTEQGTELLARLTNQPPHVVRQIGTLAGSNPRALEVIATMMLEDGITVDAITSLLEQGGDDPLETLYKDSFEALPEDYQALCRAIAATPRGWIPIESILAHYEKPIVGQRVLTFLEKRRFIERADSTVRAAGNWTDFVAGEGEGFTTIIRPTARFVARRSGENPSEAADLHAKGVALIEECNDAEAERVLKEALDLRLASDTDHAIAETLTALARASYLRGDDAAAIRYLEGAAERLHMLRDDESLEIVRIALTRAYRRAGRLDAALAVIDDSAAPEDLTAVYRARGEWDEALKVYRRWLETEPEVIYELAETLAMAGRHDEALKALSGDDSFNAQFTRAMIHHMQGNVSKALDVYNRIRLEVPPEKRAIFARAYSRALAAAGETHDAALIVSAEGVWYEAKLPRPIFAREKASQALAAYFNLVIGKLDEAERAANRLLEITGERPNLFAEAVAHRVLACAGWARDDLNRALIEFDNEIKAHSAAQHRDEHEIGVALHNIADVQRQQGEQDRAVANYRRALTHKDVSRDVRSVFLTRMALRETLIETDRADDALDAGQFAVDLMLRYAKADLQHLGYAIASQVLALDAAGQDTGHDNKRGQLIHDWLTRLAQNSSEALAHRFWAVRALAVALYLRSLPEQVTSEAVIPVDLAGQTLHDIETHVPDSPIAWAARRDLGKVYLLLERWQDAIDTLTPLFNGQVDQPRLLLDSHLYVARAAVKLEQFDDAVAHYDAARDCEPDQHKRGILTRKLGDLFREAGKESHAALRYVQALELLDQAAEPALFVDTWVALAYTRLRLRRFDDAIDTFEQTLTIVEQMPEPDPALLSSVLYDMATAHYTLTRYQRAAETYKKALEKLDRKHDTVRCVATLTALAHCYVAMESYRPALEAYHDALQYDTMTIDERRTLLAEQADVFVRIGLVQAAIDAYRAALALDGGTPQERVAIHRGLGTLYVQLDMNDLAGTQFEMALAVAEDEQTGATLLALGDVYRAQQQLPQAVTAYNRAVELLDRTEHPVELAAAHRALGEIYLGDGQAFDALKHLETALELEKVLPQQDGGRIVKTLHKLAEVHELRTELELAIRRHHEALVYQDVRYVPDSYVDTLSELGRLYALQTKYDDAVKAYEEALGTAANQPNPDTVKVNAMTGALADVYRTQGRLEAAAKLYKQVMKVMQTPAQEPVKPKGTRPAKAPSRDHVEEALQTAETDIARHLKTLEAAEQSWVLLNRVAKPDLKGLAFVRALQAQTCAALGRWEESEQRLAELMELLKSRRAELQTQDARPVIRALAMLAQGQDQADTKNWTAAQESFQFALNIAEHDPSTDAALLWAIRQKVGRGKKK